MSDISGLNPEQADEVMNFALDYYIKRHDIVFRKLKHARDATKQSIEVIDNQTPEDVSELAGIKKDEIEAYDEMWRGILDIFKQAGVSEDDLGKIEQTLTLIPSLIKKYYDLRLEQDKVLQTLMAEVESDEYKKAVAFVHNLQRRPDLMSGLPAEEFDSVMKAYETSGDSKVDAFLHKPMSRLRKA